MQQMFSKSSVFSGLAVAGLVVVAHAMFASGPNRIPRPDARASITFEPIHLVAGDASPLQLVGAWQVESPDPRLGGLSALAFDRGTLLALTDSGVVIRLPRPGPGRRMAWFHDLPAGPGDPYRKSRRDGEALARLSDGDWLVAFENRDQLWRYDADFRGGRRALDFGRENWPHNRGIEAMAVDRDDHLLLFPEASGTLIRVSDVEERYPLKDSGWTVSDAVRLPDGRLVLLLRRITAAGFRNAIGELVEAEGKWRIAVRARLPIGGIDNAEGLAAEPLPGGRTRLWIVTDNDGARYRRSLLLALDLPARRRAR